MFCKEWGLLDLSLVESQIRSEMASYDLYPKDIIIDGKIHRFIVKKGRPDGWYIFHSDGIPAGRFGCHADSNKVDVTWHFKPDKPLSQQDMNKISANIKLSKEARQEEKIRSQDAAAIVCRDIYQKARQAPEDHPYLVSKKIKPHNAKVTDDGRLITPLFGLEGEVRALQYIDMTGVKRMHTGTSFSGLYNIFRGDNFDRIFLAEGFATAASVFEATGITTFCCYPASNMVNISSLIRERCPDAVITIVADHDKSGAGQKAAAEAAEKVSAQVILIPEEGCDANDFINRGYDLKALLFQSPEDVEEAEINRLIGKTGAAVLSSDLSDEYIYPDTLIRKVICNRELSFMYGPSNTGKTYLSLQMARSIGSGDNFFGYEVEQGAVLYLAAESVNTVYQRIKFMSNYYRSKVENIFIVDASSLTFRDGSGFDVIKAHVKKIQRDHKVKVRMVVGDTWVRLTSGINENSADEVAPIIDGLQRLAKETDLHIMMIHHTGKDSDKGMRGSYTMVSNPDTIIGLHATEEGNKFFTIEKQKSMIKDETKHYYKLQSQIIGYDKYGKEVTEAIAVECVGENDNEDLQLMIKIWSESGSEYDSTGYPYLSRSVFKEHYISLGKSDNYAKKVVENKTKRLSELGKIRVSPSGYILLTQKNQ